MRAKRTASRSRPLRRELLEIARRASTLSERLEQTGAFGASGPDAEAIERRLEGWCQAVGKGDWAAFRKRLAWDGLDLDAARRALAQPPVAPRPPIWIDTLEEVLGLAASAQDGAKAELGFLDPAAPLPFEEILVPFVLVARRRLAARFGGRYELLNGESHAALERSLLRALTWVSAQALQLEFSVLRHCEQSPLDRLLGLALDDGDSALYRQFVDRMLRGGLVAFFREYAVLARLVATTADLWVEASAELLLEGRLRVAQ